MSSPLSAPPSLDAEPWWAPLDPRRRLGVRAALVAGVGALAFTLLLSWIAGRTLQRELEGPAGTALETLAFQLSDTLDRSATERIRELQWTAGLGNFRASATPVAERRRRLDALLEASPEYAWIGFADADGRIVSSTQRVLEGSDVSAQPWFRGARERPFLGDVREVPALVRGTTPEGSEPPRFVALATPVIGADGRLLGVLAAQLNWSWAREISRSLFPDTLRRNRISATFYNAKGEPLLDSGTSGWTEPPPAPNLPTRPLARGFYREKIPGDADYLTGFTRSRTTRDLRGLGIVVAVRQPAAVIDAPVVALRWGILGGGCSLSIALAAIIGIFAARVAKRLRAVGSAARRIRQGDVLSLMPSPRSQDELGTMLAELRATVDDLREKAAPPPADHPPADTGHELSEPRKPRRDGLLPW